MIITSKMKVYVFILGLMLAVGQAFGTVDCEKSDLWENCTSVPDSQMINNQQYYSITTAEELAWFAAKVNTTEKGKANISSGINAILLKDIDLSGKMWTPIAAGKGDTKFSGILDGNEHKITGLTIDGLRLAYETKNVYCDSLNPSKPYCNGQNIGLIGSLGGTVKNLTLEVADIQASNSEGLSFQMGKPISVGTLVGWMGSGTIDGVYVNGHINTSGNGQGVGGLVGNAQSGTVKNSVCDVTIYASGDDVFVGGILGYTKGAVNVNSCMYVGESIANDGANGSVGGIVGKSTVNTLNATNSFYDTDLFGDKGVGTGSVKKENKPTGVAELNTEQVACGMNGGTWDANAQTCSNQKREEWDVGISELSQNGSDGYKITFVATGNGATFPNDAVTTKIVAKNASITADGISLPTRDGYKFAGWAETDNAEDPSANLGTATGRRTIYAVWYEKFPVIFNAGSGSFPNDDPAPLIVAKGDLISLDIDVPVKSADGPQKYSFAGWSTSSEEIIFEADDEITGLWDFDNDRVSEAMTLYAAWTKAEVYTVKFNANGHGRTEWDQVNVSKDEYLATPPLTADPGYQYDGWYTELTFDNKFDFEKMLITKNYELFAKWSAIPYAINYNLDGGSVLNPGNPSTYTVEDQFELMDPSRTCYDFTEWYDSDGNHVEGITKGTTGIKTFSARWKQQTKIINYSTGNIIQATATTQEFLCGENITLSDTINAFSRSGYTQDGWTTTVGGNNVLAPKSSYVGTANVTLYAHWSPITYSINYELDGGEFATSAVSTYTVDDEIAIPEPAKFGYTFAGWFDNADFEGDAMTVVPQGSTGDRTFYAKWIRDASTISVVAKSQVFEYDGNSHKAECEIAADNPWGYTITATTDDQVTDVQDGEVPASCNVVIMAGDEDITASFEGFIEYVPGTISVVAKAVPYGAVTIYTDETGSRAVIDGTSSETVNITDEDKVVVNAVTFNRTFPVNAEGENKMSTLTLPFSIEKSKVSGAEFYELNDVVGTKVRIWKSLDVLEANTPYIIRTTADHLTFTLDEGDKLTLNTEKMNNSKSSDGLWEIRGVYEYKQWTEGDKELGLAYGYTAKATNNLSVGKFAKNGVGAYIKPLRAYLLKTPEKQAQKARRMLAKSIASISSDTDSDELDVEIVDRETGETTIIGKLNKATGEIKVINNWYDMKGRKLNAKPTTKGIYYFNGKRVMVK